MYVIVDISLTGDFPFAYQCTTIIGFPFALDSTYNILIDTTINLSQEPVIDQYLSTPHFPSHSCQHIQSHPYNYIMYIFCITVWMICCFISIQISPSPLHKSRYSDIFICACVSVSVRCTPWGYTLNHFLYLGFVRSIYMVVCMEITCSEFSSLKRKKCNLLSMQVKLDQNKLLGTI